MANAVSPVPNNQSSGGSNNNSGSTSLELAASTLLPSCAQDVEKALDTLCNALEAVAQDSQSKRQTVEASLQSWLDKKRQWGQEQTALLENVARLETEVTSTSMLSTKTTIIIHDDVSN